MISKQQAIDCDMFHANGCTRHIGPRGGVKESIEQWRRNGVTKTWKTRPTEFRIPVKFGMYGYGYIEDSTAHQAHTAEDCPLNDPEYVTK